MLKKPKITESDERSELGDKIRQSRKGAKMTMQVLADRAGLSVGFISQIERGITVPSISSLRAIAEVLDLPVSYFLEQPESSEDTTRFSKRVPYQVGDGALSYERLSVNFPGSTIRSVIVHEPPGHRVEPTSHEGEEMFFILHGALTVEVEGKVTRLREGDSIHFDSRKVHSIWNHTTDTASMLWCGTMDVFGEDALEPVHKGG